MTCIEFEDLTGRFLGFYKAAAEQNPDSEARWKLWQARYNFAPLPPTAERDRRARELLELAWPRYRERLDRIGANAATVRTQVQPLLGAVRDQLGYGGPITVRVILFVGMLDGNAFGYRRDAECVVAIPVEGADQQIPMALVHELSHAVHGVKARLSEGWVRSVGEFVIQEGLATRTTQAVFPGRAPDRYLDTDGEVTPLTAGADGLSWYEACRRSRLAILRGVRGSVARCDVEAVQRFLIGPGPSGLLREAYYAGWEIVGALLGSSWTLSTIAAKRPESLPAVATDGIRLALRA